MITFLNCTYIGIFIQIMSLILLLFFFTFEKKLSRNRNRNFMFFIRRSSSEKTSFIVTYTGSSLIPIHYTLHISVSWYTNLMVCMINIRAF